jgi:hypothetical protein
MKQFARAMTRGLYAVAFSLWCIGAVLAQSAPQPLLNANTPVDWWFVFKFNAATGPGCTGQKTPACIFGGKPGKYADYDGTVQWGQHFAVASSANPTPRRPHRRAIPVSAIQSTIRSARPTARSTTARPIFTWSGTISSMPRRFRTAIARGAIPKV